jgi:hypothetical protein
MCSSNATAAAHVYCELVLVRFHQGTLRRQVGLSGQLRLLNGPGIKLSPVSGIKFFLHRRLIPALLLNRKPDCENM